MNLFSFSVMVSKAKPHTRPSHSEIASSHRTLLAMTFGALILAACSSSASEIPVSPPPTETPTARAIIALSPTPSRASPSSPVPSVPSVPTPIARSGEIELDATGAPLIAPNTNTIYTAYDFLRGYFTNRTHAIIVESKPWTNSTVNVKQYQEELGGVTYWDFFSELENWDSPFFMWQDDDGQWQPYRKETIRNSPAYLIVDRKGPGAMDKLWFTQDAVWMLATEESKRNVGPIRNLDELIEWGNLDKLGNLRIEVDDRIAYDGAIVDWFSGKALGMTPDLARALTWRHREFGSIGSIVPVLYQKHLRVLTYGGTKKPKWFLATGVRLPDNTRVRSFAGNVDFPREETARNVSEPDKYIDTFDHVRAFDAQIVAGKPATIQLNGAGTLAALQFRIAKKFDPKQLTLRVKYGDQVGIALPLIAFFGDHKQIVAHRSTPLGIIVENDAYVFYSNLPMPFQNGMTLELTSPTALGVNVRLAAASDTPNTQLRATFRAGEKLAAFGPDFQVALPGDGKLVGLVLVTDEQAFDKIPKVFLPGKPNVEDPEKKPWTNGYLEGNLTLRDGSGATRVYAGHEDWADGGFYFNRGYTEPAGGSNRAFGGILRYQNGKDGYATIFRYFNDLSAFRFKNGLHMSFGHGTWKNNFPVTFGATVFYYREMPSANTIS
ncbi:MAG: DUF2961 domain-containing protein [Chloroflexi bacterium]|nr:DUF2961 domain-containing protein [Chloroflexota bacterium]